MIELNDEDEDDPGALHYNIKQNALKSLISNVNNLVPNILPKDLRTLLKTPATATVVWQVGDGQYWHQGLKSCLEEVLFFEDGLHSISINISMNGLPIYNSSKDEFWPILFNIYEKPELKPMVIGVFWGKGKPSDLNAFMKHFVDEMLEIMQAGIIINNRKFDFKIRCFICDSPARTLIKGKMNNVCFEKYF